ncbi:MAG: efflux RND transporter permease subunit [Proteobacteria bacterium]|nr:efflux RND transporter permease subunit [Pseudomonadota bacterium]
MFLSDLSIKRPVFATVLSAVLVLFGFFAFNRMTVRELPDIDPPIISVSTVYRGASAEIIESQVTQVIEEAIAGIGGIKRINSTSREESSSVSIEFNLDRDIDGAANDVRDRVSRAIRNLPRDADAPRIAKSDSDARAIMWMSLTSDRLDSLELTALAERTVADRLSIVSGVASVRIGGGRHLAMRVWLDRNALAARQLTAGDVEAAIRRQNVALASGRIESVLRELTVNTKSSLVTEEDFRNIVVAEREGFFIRLGEVAEVRLAAENDRSEYRVNGQSAVGIGIVKQSQANTLDVASGVRDVVADIEGGLPAGTRIIQAFDQSLFISGAIREVFVAIGVALVLVIAVNFVFLRSFRATLIPAIAIPVSITSTFIVLGALGFSINILTLLAIVLSIGLVVDDAIVVLENIHRRIEGGEPPLLASLLGTRQIAFAVIATTVVLVSVFVPISFMEGSTGRLFSEFGITVAAAVIFSSFVALTLTPMMCSKLLRPPRDEGLLFRLSERGFKGLTRGYGWAVHQALRAPIVVVAVAVGFSALSFWLFSGMAREFAPTEDRGSFFISVSAPEGASLEYTRRYVLEIEKQLEPILGRGDAQRVLSILAPSFGRPGAVNSAFLIISLRPWAERDVKQQDVVKEIFPGLLRIPGVRAFAVNPATLGHSRFGAPVQIVLGGPSYETLTDWGQQLIDRARENPGLVNVNMNFRETQPRLRVEIDRDRAADLGVSIEDIGRTLKTMLGTQFVSTFDRDGQRYNVIMQGRPEDRTSPSDLSRLFVRAGGGEIVPLSNLVKVTQEAGPPSLGRVDRLRAITVRASLAGEYTLGEAVRYMERIAAEELPSEARVTLGGQSRDFKESSNALFITFGLALLIAFLALAAQFESFIHPVVIMLSVPLAVTGALASMKLAGVTVNIYSQIGMVMLIGLIAKNAILIVEFANQLRDQGLEIIDAVHEAAIIRLRPILMTSIATGAGALPLAFGTGAGAEARRALGTVIVGGVAFSTVLSLFVVPVLYFLLARYTKPVGHIARRLSVLEEKHRAAARTVAVRTKAAAKPVE